MIGRAYEQKGSVWGYYKYNLVVIHEKWQNRENCGELRDTQRGTGVWGGEGGRQRVGG